MSIQLFWLTICVVVGLYGANYCLIQIWRTLDAIKKDIASR
jgi:hypothetical protein